MWLVSLARLQVTQQLHVTLDIWRLEVDDGLDGAGRVLDPSGVGLNLAKRIILSDGVGFSSREAIGFGQARVQGLLAGVLAGQFLQQPEGFRTAASLNQDAEIVVQGSTGAILLAEAKIEV